MYVINLDLFLFLLISSMSRSFIREYIGPINRKLLIRMFFCFVRFCFFVFLPKWTCAGNNNISTKQFTFFYWSSITINRLQRIWRILRSYTVYETYIDSMKEREGMKKNYQKGRMKRKNVQTHSVVQ